MERIEALHDAELPGIVGQVLVACLGHHDEVFETDTPDSLLAQPEFDRDDVAGS